MKKIGLVLLVLTIMGGTFSSSAKDQTMILFNGNSNKFIAPKEEWVNFRMMDPGEERIQPLKLTNQSSKQYNFYMSVDVMKNIASQAAGDATYEIKVSDGDEVLLDESVTSGQKKENSQLGKEWNFATLKPGESKEVDLSITLDGESMGNEYQGTDGKIQIVFAVEEPKTVLKTNGNSRTGDVVKWSLIVAVVLLLIASGGTILLLLNRDEALFGLKRKKDLEDGDTQHSQTYDKE